MKTLETILPTGARLLVLFLAAVLAATVPAFAQQEAEVDTQFSEVIDVRVINLEVVVEDDGVRVHGLQPQDFELTVDGREVPIEYFTEVVGGVATARQGSTADATVPAQVPGEVVATSYLLFIDDHFSISRDRDRVLDHLIEQLPNIRPSDQMAVVAYDGKKVDMLSNWSSSVNALTRTLREAKDRPADGLLRLAERQGFRTDQELITEGLSFGNWFYESSLGERQITAEEEYWVQRTEARVRRAVMAATATLRSFAQPRGRKVMLLLSGGWPSDPVSYIVADPNRVSTNRVLRGNELVGPLAKTANLLGYTIYPVDVPGLEPDGVDVSVPTTAAGDFRRLNSESQERENQFTLHQLASETGGKAMVNSLRDVALERVVADLQSYYWIGFTPSWKGDDSVHDVKVKVRDRKYKIRSRKNFSDLSRTTEVNMMVESALRFGGAPGGIPLAAEVGRGKKAGWGKRQVPLRIAIPLDALTFLPTADGFEARAELRVAVLDESGGTADIPVIPIELTSQRPPRQGEALPYETAIKMRNQAHDLVVSIYDNASGRILSAKLEVKKN
ncbi:MAG: VWA domain-containing protein [Thermoanaerobaculia bacterium]|nr:VWA domain-containing protein [Thermoanaerobaculia bacterium]